MMKKSNLDEKLYNREALMMDVTEDLLIVMEDKEVKKSDLAKLLCKSKSFVTQTLSGSRNITLRTLADMAFALGVKVSVKFEEVEEIQTVLVDDKEVTAVPIESNNVTIYDIVRQKEILICDVQENVYTTPEALAV